VHADRRAPIAEDRLDHRANVAILDDPHGRQLGCRNAGEDRAVRGCHQFERSQNMTVSPRRRSPGILIVGNDERCKCPRHQHVGAAHPVAIDQARRGVDDDFQIVRLEMENAFGLGQGRARLCRQHLKAAVKPVHLAGR